MVKNKKHTILSIVTAIVVSAVMLTVSVTNVALSATVDTSKITAPAATARLTAKTMLYASIFKRCLGSLSTMLTNNNFLSLNSYESESLYSIGSGTVAVGPDVANAFGDSFLQSVFANDDDGVVYCRELQGNNKSLLTAFAGNLGVAPENLICSADNHPGLYLPYDENFLSPANFFLQWNLLNASNIPTEIVDSIKFNSCKQSKGYLYLGDTDAVQDPNTGAVYPVGANYIKGLYENWRAGFEDNSGILSWDELDNPAAGSILQKYWLYTADFEAACTATPANDGDQGSYKIVRFENGAYLYQDVSVESQSDYTGKQFFLYNGVKTDCHNLASELDRLSGDYYKQVKASLGQSCQDFYANDEDGLKLWRKITNNPDAYSSDEVKNAEKALKKYNKLKDSGDPSDFVKVDSSGVMSCKNMGDLAVEVVDGNDQTDSELYGNEDACNGAHAKLGWILCPLINNLQQALSGLYEETIEPMLQVNVSAFDATSDVYRVWQIFQNMANIVFVIIFLFAIFSQITGWGIDNYGIKRLLPKLIVAAVLVNLSFIICQVFVDVSNIVGNGAKDLLMGIQIGGQNANDNALGTFISGQALLGTGTAVAGAGAAAAVATGAVWIPSLLLPFLLGLLSVLIAIVFMFILLGIRQAGIIILVVISPLAFVMYMLPNTKRIFDRWKGLFQALLLLYPICGLMIGGCALAGKVIIASADNFWMALLGGLLSVIPFFLIPNLTKSAMSAVGKIGSMITGAGQRIGGGLQRAAGAGLNRSRLAKNLQSSSQLHERERERRRLQSVASRASSNINRLNSLNALTPAQNRRLTAENRRLAMAQSQLNRMTQEDAESDTGVKPLNYNQARSTAESRRFNTEVEAIKLQNTNSGIAGRVGDMKDSAFNKGEAFASDTLAGSLYRAAQDPQNSEAQYAAVNQLMSSGHHGEQALHQVMQRLGEEGNASALRNIAKAAKDDRNFGGLKGASRSTYDYINAIANGDIISGDTVAANEILDNTRVGGSTKFSNMSQEGLVGTNKEELRRYAEALESGNIGAEQAVALRNLATAALNNDRLAGKRKGEVEDVLQQIAGQKSFTEIKVDHDAQSAGAAKLSTPATASSQPRKIDAGALERAAAGRLQSDNTLRSTSNQSSLYARIRGEGSAQGGNGKNTPSQDFDVSRAVESQRLARERITQRLSNLNSNNAGSANASSPNGENNTSDTNAPTPSNPPTNEQST